MISITLHLMSLIALGAAQYSTVSLFIPGADIQSLVASIAGSDSTATTYVVECADGAAATSAGAADTSTVPLAIGSASATASATDFVDPFGGDGSDGCGFPTAFTVTQGPSTVHYGVSSGDVTESLNCQLIGSTQAVCTASVTGTELLDSTGAAFATATLGPTDITLIPVVITAGSATAKATGSATAKITSSTGMIFSTGMTSSIGGDSTSSKGTSSTSSTTLKATTGTSSTSSAITQSTNAAMQGAPAFGAGVLGAFGVAVAGAIL